MISEIKFLRKTQKGLALAMAALMLPVFSLIMVFAVDIGLATTAQSRIETAVNQAANAAVQRLPDEVGATAMAESLTRLTLSDSARFGTNLNIEVTTTSDTITIVTSLRSRSFFGGLVNRRFYNVTAQATRILAS